MVVSNIFSFSHNVFKSLLLSGHKNWVTCGKGLTLSQTSPSFKDVCCENLLKAQWEKEKLLIPSNFSFFQSVFCPFGKLSTIFIELNIVICQLFQFAKSLKFVFFGKGLKCSRYMPGKCLECEEKLRSVDR